MIHVTAEELAEAREVLGDRLDDLEADLRRLSAQDLAQHIHSIKGLASAYGFKVVAGIAHALESSLAQNGPQTPVLAYLDRMHEALSSSRPDDPALLQGLLETVRVRMHAG